MKKKIIDRKRDGIPWSVLINQFVPQLFVSVLPLLA